MKAYVIQPPYSKDLSRSDELFAFRLSELDKCSEDADIIVLPEYSDVPCATTNLKDTINCHRRYIGPLLDKCRETAIRCKSNVFVNALSEEDTGYRNTTYCYNSRGELAGKYFKRHIPPFEIDVLGLDSDYTNEFSEPYVLEIDGARYGFLTCYDFYFYEALPCIANSNVDVIIGCSLQRSDTHSAIEIMCRFIAYNTNAYVIRSSVSFDENSVVCGASMIVAPDGTVLENMKGHFGTGCAEFDVHKKYLKPAGFGRGDAPHYEYIEYGRKPIQYRQAGSSVLPCEAELEYPRLCAHRGFSVVAPENTMPAWGAAVAMGAQEIELDIWPSKDGEIVSCHDRELDRVSTGSGDITEHTLAELCELDFGIKFDEKFKGLSIVRFEDVLKKFSCRVIMNIHVKPISYTEPYPEEILRKIVALIRKYDAQRHVYFMLKTDYQIKQFKEFAPDIPVCVGHLSERPWDIVDRAIELGCEKVQLFKPYYNQEMIDKAHMHGIRCNIFWSDEPEEAKRFIEMGIDTILTNDYNNISNALGI